MKAALAFCLIAGAAFPALADDVLKRPKACERVATAQFDNCEVSNYFKCSGASSVVYREETVDSDDIHSATNFDKNWGALGFADTNGDFVASMKTRTEHPRIGLQSGKHSEVFRGNANILGSTLEITGRLDQFYKGEKKEIAKETFHRFSGKGAYTFAGTIAGNAVNMSARFQTSMLYNEQHDLWLVEDLRLKVDGEPETRSRLKLLSLPGQRGFGATNQQFGCINLSMYSNTHEVPA